jgi:hypothetical protein
MAKLPLTPWTLAFAFQTIRIRALLALGPETSHVARPSFAVSPMIVW